MPPTVPNRVPLRDELLRPGEVEIYRDVRISIVCDGKSHWAIKQMGAPDRAYCGTCEHWVHHHQKGTAPRIPAFANIRLEFTSPEAAVIAIGNLINDKGGELAKVGLKITQVTFDNEGKAV